MLIALNAHPELGRDAVCRLAQRIDAWAQTGGAVPGFRAETLQRAREVTARAGPRARREISRAADLGIRLLTLLDRAYPEPLRDLALPPPVLYVRGRLGAAPAIAIVGSRRAGAYGLEAAALFGRELAERGITVVSGLAYGIDGAAHRAALEAPGGTTVAVMGRGLDGIYPGGHRRLAAAVAARGALVTEFPLGAGTQPWNFPVRNRIIAALALGTLVVEATPRSGSLITAGHALELGRDVYAVPGRIFDRGARGPNALIRDGALAAGHPRDILESLPDAVRSRLRPGGEAPREPAAGPQADLLRLLTPGDPLAVETLAERLGRPVDRVLGLLLELELAGWVRRHPGPAFGRRS